MIDSNTRLIQHCWTLQKREHSHYCCSAFFKKIYNGSPCCTLKLTTALCLQRWFAWRIGRLPLWAWLCRPCKSSCPGCLCLTAGSRRRPMSSACVAAAAAWLSLRSRSQKRWPGRTERMRPGQRAKSWGQSFSSCRCLSLCRTKKIQVQYDDAYFVAEVRQSCC